MPAEKLKFMHCADIHLDSAFDEPDPEKAALRRNELRAAFTAMLTYARINGVRLMLIAGDLFDGLFVTRDTIAHVRREFAACPDCRFVISPGNHDPYTPNGVYAKTAFPDNVFIFSEQTLSYFPFDDLNVSVYGYAFTSSELPFNPFAGLELPDDGRIHILCGHGDLGSASSRYCPIRREEITDAGFDYAALGHIHNSDGIHRMDGCWYGYSGCIEGRDYGECGYKGAVYIKASKENGIFDAEVKGLRFSRRRYEKLDADLTGTVDENAAYSFIADTVTKSYSADTSLRVTLTGSIPSDMNLSSAYIRELLADKLFSLEIYDKTTPLLDRAALESDPTIRGVFFRELLPGLDSSDPSQRELASAALRAGLSAISGSL